MRNDQLTIYPRLTVYARTVHRSADGTGVLDRFGKVHTGKRRALLPAGIAPHVPNHEALRAASGRRHRDGAVSASRSAGEAAAARGEVHPRSMCPRYVALLNLHVWRCQFRRAIGDLVLIHGSVLHKSERNRSPHTRFAYTFHMIESPPFALYDNKNWLQPTLEAPFSRILDVPNSVVTTA